MSPDPGFYVLSSPSAECGRYMPGHDVHYIQALKSRKLGDPEPVSVVAVGDDGTISLQDGRQVWNHDPAVLRQVLARCGPRAELWPLNLLAIQNIDDPQAWMLFYLSDGPSPCPRRGPRTRPGESLVAETLRRGGATADLKRVEAEARRRPSGSPPRPRGRSPSAPISDAMPVDPATPSR